MSEPIMTRLQELLRGRSVAIGEVARRCRRHRVTVYRWAGGQGFPDREAAQRLLELYAGAGLDYNGIYGAGPRRRTRGAAR